jgi:hypothetical protein
VLAYGIMNVLALAALPRDESDAARDRLDNLRSLFHRAPAAAVMIGIAMVSLAGFRRSRLHRQVPHLQERDRRRLYGLRGARASSAATSASTSICASSSTSS